jgi:hypothetical protein
MKEFLESFSNREISIVFWSLLIVVVALFLNISASTHLIKSFFAKQLTYIYCVMALYLSAIICFLYSIGLWEISLFKDFLFWLLTSAFVMLFSFNKLKNNNDFKSILLKLLTINIILEFIASNYNFSLIKELLLIPFVTFVSILIIVAQQKKNENEKVIKFLNVILSYIGFVIFCYVIYRLIKSPSELFTVKNLKSFLLAPLLTILLIPFVFLVTVYSKYEEIFMNINRYNFLSEKRKSKIKFAFLKFGNLNLEYLNNAHNITIWRKAELLNEEKINLYIRNEIKNDVKFIE